MPLKGPVSIPQSRTLAPRALARETMSERFALMTGSAMPCRPSFPPSSTMRIDGLWASAASSLARPSAVVSPQPLAFFTIHGRDSEASRPCSATGNARMALGESARLSPSTTMREAPAVGDAGVRDSQPPASIAAETSVNRSQPGCIRP